MSEQFNINKLKQWQKVDNDEASIMDPETRLITLKASDLEAQKNQVKTKATEYLNEQKLQITDSLKFHMNYALTNKLILKIQPSSQDDITKICRISGFLLKAKIQTMPRLFVLKNDLYEIPGLGQVYVEFLEQRIFNENL